MPGSFPADPIQKGKAQREKPRERGWDILRRTIYPPSVVVKAFISSEIQRGKGRFHSPPVVEDQNKPGLNRVKEKGKGGLTQSHSLAHVARSNSGRCADWMKTVFFLSFLLAPHSPSTKAWYSGYKKARRRAGSYGKKTKNNLTRSASCDPTVSRRKSHKVKLKRSLSAQSLAKGNNSCELHLHLNIAKASLLTTVRHLS